MPDPDLSSLECRALGCLIEKQLSTPDVYPLSLNTLVNACNQSSNRDPVLAASEAEVQEAADTLVALGLAERWPGRVMKYAHMAKPRWNLAVQEAAILAELLLRGPQTPGELRSRCQRMYAFPDMAALEGCLGTLLESDPPLVARLPKAPGAREARVAHLLAGPVEGPVSLAPAAPGAPRTARLDELEAEVRALRDQLAGLRAEFEAFKEQLP